MDRYSNGYGWDIEDLRLCVYSTTRAVYNHNIDVKFEIIHNKIRVRSDSWLSRMLLHTAMESPPLDPPHLPLPLTL